ncbi:MAG: hypothetical protein C0609_03010 [Deltaproteobacteria bacterium]|nr:MAG: hypothetical protein C0609_03010 [Deltaproteobacteria bacterium]
MITSHNNAIGAHADQATREAIKTAFIKNVYSWMAGGLALSAIAALAVVKSDFLMVNFVMDKTWFMALLFTELALVFAISFGINKISASTAGWLFIIYSILTGATLSVVLLRYTPVSIFQSFVVASSIFGAAAIYGTYTKRDLTGWGSYLFMALIGLIVATVINIFTASAWLDWALTYGGALLFTLLAAYDSQKIQRIGYRAAELGMEALSKQAILGALALYLDFVNLFLYMLRIFGRGRD